MLPQASIKRSARPRATKYERPISLAVGQPAFPFFRHGNEQRAMMHANCTFQQHECKLIGLTSWEIGRKCAYKQQRREISQESNIRVMLKARLILFFAMVCALVFSESEGEDTAAGLGVTQCAVSGH